MLFETDVIFRRKILLSPVQAWIVWNVIAKMFRIFLGFSSRHSATTNYTRFLRWPLLCAFCVWLQREGDHSINKCKKTADTHC